MLCIAKTGVGIGARGSWRATLELKIFSGCRDAPALRFSSTVVSGKDLGGLDAAGVGSALISFTVATVGVGGRVDASLRALEVLSPAMASSWRALQLVLLELQQKARARATAISVCVCSEHIVSAASSEP